jgi:hypothetical protein
MLGVLGGGVLVATSALAQTSSPVRERPADRRDSVENYLQSKERDFEQGKAGAAALGAGGNVTAIYNLLKEKKAFEGKVVRGKDAAQQGRVRDALTQTVAQYLVAVGMTPAEINRLTRAQYDPLKSAELAISGQARLEDSLLIAEIPLLVEITGSEAATDPAGQLAQRVSFSVLNNVKNVRGATGSLSLLAPYSGSSGQLQAGQRCLLFLSRSLGTFRKGARIAAIEGDLQQQEAPYCLTGDSYQRLSINPLDANASPARVEEAVNRLSAVYK